MSEGVVISTAMPMVGGRRVVEATVAAFSSSLGMQGRNERSWFCRNSDRLGAPSLRRRERSCPRRLEGGSSANLPSPAHQHGRSSDRG